MADKEKRIVLKGDEAVALWLQGDEAWNAWVEENPVADVDFSGVYFSEFETIKKSSEVNFMGFYFPSGNVRFDGATFGDCNKFWSSWNNSWRRSSSWKHNRGCSIYCYNSPPA